MHEIVNLLQLAHTNNLDWRLDETAAKEVNGFGGVFPIADVGAFDGDASEDCFEDWGFQESIHGESNDDDGAAGSDVLFKTSAVRGLVESPYAYLSCLLEWFLVDSYKEDRVWAEACLYLVCPSR